MRGCKLSDKEIAGIVKCSELGLNQYQTAKILDVSQATISRSASKYGIKFENWRDQTCDKCGVNYCKCENAKAFGVNDFKKQANQPPKPSTTIGGNSRPRKNDPKRDRRNAAIKAIKNEKCPAIQYEIAYGWRFLELQIGNGTINLKSTLTSDQKAKNRRDEQERSEAKRQYILSFFVYGKDLNASDVKELMGKNDIGMSIQTISSFMDGMSKIGRLKRYRFPFKKKGPNYWYYHLP